MYAEMAYADVFIREAYMGTPWEHKINAEGGHGDKVPAIRMGTGVTILWWEFSDGHVRLDGKEWKVDRVRAQLRKAFKGWKRGKTTEHSS